MITSFKHKGLEELFRYGRSSRVGSDLHERIIRRLNAIYDAATPEALDVNHGFNFHVLHGKPTRYSIHVNGPWCITFEFENGHACQIDLENYH